MAGCTVVVVASPRSSEDQENHELHVWLEVHCPVSTVESIRGNLRYFQLYGAVYKLVW